jgi:superfamily I DNA/RNA helicase
MIRGRREAILPSDIAVLFPATGAQPHKLADKLNAFTKAAVLQTYADRLDQDAVRIISIQRATGLQFRIVILLGTDLLPANFTDRDDRTLLYLGMTRAEDVLVILHSGRSKLVDEIHQALSGQNATSA